ncbi:aminotransferase class V-fold PLP-dependent enzyme [Isoalcanivorax beigongshangi]|uniref:Cysteine desulfurase n=1 Tax=Isoalcanivorax beigongshangi TaxID=3238810 RepID=A0ABV4AM09_9GAMM
MSGPITLSLPERLRQEFPILSETPYGKPLVYLDNAATTQKPNAVIDAVAHYYRHQNSNVHRGAHYLGDLATAALENARDSVARFIGADREEVIWTRGTTESINLVAHGLRSQLRPGDEVLISSLEHHANIVPWQQACAATGATLKVIPLQADASLDLTDLDQLINANTRVLAVTWASNALGVVTPLHTLIARARDVGALVVVDAAQAISHFQINVRELDCDFMAFSGHKMFGPTGIGVLYGRKEHLNALPPYQTGGEMIETVTFETATWNQLPYKFEAGTPHIAGAIGLGAAVEWLARQDRSAFLAHENDLRDYLTERARAFPGLRIIGDTADKVATLSFLLDGAHPNDVGTLLDQQGVAVRTGHHCTMPLMNLLGIPGTVRASLAPYNSRDDVDALFTALEKAARFL